MKILLIGASSVDSFIQLVTVLVLFAFVLGATFLTTKFVGNFQKVQSKNRNFELIEVFRLSNSTYLQLVRIGNKYFVIAVGKEQANVVTEIDEEDIIRNTDNNSGNEMFSQILSKAKERLSNKGEDNE